MRDRKNSPSIRDVWGMECMTRSSGEKEEEFEERHQGITHNQAEFSHSPYPCWCGWFPFLKMQVMNRVDVDERGRWPKEKREEGCRSKDISLRSPLPSF